MREMKKPTWIIFIVEILLITLLWSCASFNFTVPQPPDKPVLLYVKFCREIIVGENPSGVELIDEGTLFKPNEDKIWIVLSLSHLNGYHTMRWRWYAPDRSLFADTDEFPINPDGQYHRIAMIWDYINLEGVEKEKSLGRWTVAIFLDGKLMSTNHFTISE